MPWRRALVAISLTAKTTSAIRSGGSPAAVASLYQSRGHSSDTEIEAGYAVYVALATLKQLEPQRRIARVLIVGPGLDLASPQRQADMVAEALGNTAAMSRKSYIHPSLIDAAKDNPRDPLGGMERPRERTWLSTAEVGFLQFLAKARRGKRKATAS